MKFFIALAFFIVAAVAVNAAGINIPDAYKIRAKEIDEECRSVHTVSEEEYAKLRSGEIFEASEEAMCFTNCFQEKAGILKDGVFQEENALVNFSSSLGEEKTKALIASCKGEVGSGKCETAYKLHTCFKLNKAY